MLREPPGIVRVFVPTYRRRSLLPRALESLRAQTFTEWRCEVHNDDPADSFPAELIRSLGDRRIELRDHEQNLGPVATFNLFYRPTPEPFYALLEDDNWWESQFLDTMVRAMQAHPDVTLAWCNQKIWEELPDGSWQDTGQLANPREISGPRLIEFGNFRQIMGAIHSNGAMILRSRTNETYLTPPNFPFFAVEAFRERMVPHPVLYVPQPLAIFSRTLETARSEEQSEGAIVQIFLAATYIKHARFGDLRVAQVLADARSKRPPTTDVLLFAAAVEPACRGLLRHTNIADWLLLLRCLVRRPIVLWHVMRSRRSNADWWHLLDQHTAARFDELRSRSS